MANEGDVVKVTGISGKVYEYVFKDAPRQGGMKKVYFSPDKKYVVAFYHEKQPARSVARLKEIIGEYRKQIFEGKGGDYWKEVFCWPTDVIEDGSDLGLVMPAYPARFFFKQDGKQVGARITKLQGKEKNGEWFVTPMNRFGRVSDAEAGDWHNYFGVCLMLARGVRRLHFAGLAHSDLSINNVLIDPATNSSVIIDIDGLVVPDKYPPDVAGTAGYLAPEVIESSALPSQYTDLHALAVLIYQYLLCRHPLDGSAFFPDVPPVPEAQNPLKFGSRAVFIEHPSDTSNRYDFQWATKTAKPREVPLMSPWKDLQKLPYTALGPYLKRVFDKAFVDGLHDPSKRPHADEWESALTKTIDMLVPCTNPNCTQKWHVYDPSKGQQKCPFCDEVHKGAIPILHMHRPWRGEYYSEKVDIVGFHGKRINTWNSRPGVAWTEQLSDEEKKPIAAIQLFNGSWYLTNVRSDKMLELGENKSVPVGGSVLLKDGMQVRLEGKDSRMAKVEIVNL